MDCALVLALMAALAPAALACAGCSSEQPILSAPEAAVQRVEGKLAGVWQLTGYVPEKDLPASVTLDLQTDRILIRFDEGMVRSATTALEFDRRYRLADIEGDTFKVFIEDSAGIEYESHCRFDEGGDIVFEMVTEPWRGRGVLTRDQAPDTEAPQ